MSCVCQIDVEHLGDDSTIQDIGDHKLDAARSIMPLPVGHAWMQDGAMNHLRSSTCTYTIIVPALRNTSIIMLL